MTQQLPACDHRAPTNNPAVHFCAHDKVHAQDNLVTDRVCQLCPWRTTPCLAPRPFPGETPTAPPSLGRRLRNFTVAAIAHVLAGLPTCSQEQIDTRLALCQACPHFDPHGLVCKHKSCGCNVGDQKKFLNKLAWADQKCPIGKWGPASP